MRKCIEWGSSKLSPYFSREINLISTTISSRLNELYERRTKRESLKSVAIITLLLKNFAVERYNLLRINLIFVIFVKFNSGMKKKRDIA